MKRHLVTVFAFLFLGTMTAGCLPTQTIIVKFEDLKSDFFALEQSLESGEWAKFDWNTMTITISSVPRSTRPVALGSFQISQAAQPDAAKPVSVAAASDEEINLSSLEMSDTLVSIMRRRQARYARIQDLIRAQSVGIAYESPMAGLLVAAPGKRFQDLEAAQRETIEAENTDRLLLFDEVLRQRQLPAEKRPRVAETFYDVLVNMAPRGTWIQAKETSNWVQKP